MNRNAKQPLWQAIMDFIHENSLAQKKKESDGDQSWV
jgi:hypothetical protein